MGERYRQFLGSKPGITVELIDDSSSPYRVRTDEGFEFLISAEDFRNYYKEADTPTPSAWRRFFTNRDRGLVDAPRAAKAMEIVEAVGPAFKDFETARDFVREAARITQSGNSTDVGAVRRQLNEAGWNTETIPDTDLEGIITAPDDIRAFLSDRESGNIHLIDAVGGRNGEPIRPSTDKLAPKKPSKERDTAKPGAKLKPTGMKNIELAIENETLTITVDLSVDLGPSKSGKSFLVASSQGSKKLPGREERIGLTIYRQESKRKAKGRRKEFKNVVMDTQGDILTITVDLSQDHGPSKSGKTIIVASTEGNQRVYDREERIGLNVYRKID